MAYVEYTTGIQPSVFGADDQYSKVQGTRDGAPFSADWVLARCLEGRVFVANVGTVTSPATFGAGDIDGTEFDLHVSVPSGTTVIPLEIRINIEAYGTTAIFQTMAVSGTGSTCGAGTTITPRSIRTDLPFSSLCTITSAATATSGVAITGNEFWRDGLQKAATTATGDDDSRFGGETFVWSHKTAGYAPVVVGAGQIGVFAAGQATTGFITLVYVEFPSTRVV